MKRWTPVEVIWDDAHGSNDCGWTSCDSIAHKPQKIRTVGMLWKEDDEGVSVVLSYDKDSRNVADHTFIPRQCITSFRGLE